MNTSSFSMYCTKTERGKTQTQIYHHINEYKTMLTVDIHCHGLASLPLAGLHHHSVCPAVSNW